MKSIRVFVASPSDLDDERQALAELLEELNQTIGALAPEKGLHLELVRWETHAIPAAGRGQEVVTRDVGAYDVFVGIMWRRFGTPTGEADSGTEEEFRLAYKRWQRERKPHIMFYFCQAAAPPAKSVEDAEQQLRVVAFRDEVRRLSLVWEYREHGEFKGVVRPHLLAAIARLAGTDPASTAGLAILSPQEELALTNKLRTLGAEYTALRESMDSGFPRTRQLELVATRIRTLALQGLSLVNRFANSEVHGERLVAVAFLQVQPRAALLPWLGQRLSEEHAFLAYHAAVGLLAAARNLDCSLYPEIGAAIDDGFTRLRARDVGENSDRYRTLAAARHELDVRCSVRASSVSA